MVNATIWSFDFVEDVAVHDEIHVALPNDLNQDFVMKVQEHIRMEQAGLMIDCSLEKKNEIIHRKDQFNLQSFFCR